MREVTLSSRRGFLADVLEKQHCWLSLPTRAFLSSNPPSLSATRSELPSSGFPGLQRLLAENALCFVPAVTQWQAHAGGTLRSPLSK